MPAIPVVEISQVNDRNLKITLSESETWELGPEILARVFVWKGQNAVPVRDAIIEDGYELLLELEETGTLSDFCAVAVYYKDPVVKTANDGFPLEPFYLPIPWP